MQQVDTWVAWVAGLGGAALSRGLGFIQSSRKMKNDDRSAQFQELLKVYETSKDSYHTQLKASAERLAILETQQESFRQQQKDNTTRIAELSGAERECKKTVELLTKQVGHYAEQNATLLSYLLKYDEQRKTETKS